ncbi:hypothetical protein Bpfe_020092 [Biomphalaria pfeifferi]|uniref:Uncharacterized protein n=1 Tax=Biomphalaria pfeifferi TaxID=112525 RepID=A0AAD8B9D5_BIOPF|nr:hypothetical protein Bpfe_020092 [Biomphalaria pfeifferi]
MTLNQRNYFGAAAALPREHFEPCPLTSGQYQPFNEVRTYFSTVIYHHQSMEKIIFSETCDVSSKEGEQLRGRKKKDELLEVGAVERLSQAGHLTGHLHPLQT